MDRFSSVPSGARYNEKTVDRIPGIRIIIKSGVKP